MTSPLDGWDMLMNVFGQVYPAPQAEMCGALNKDDNSVSPLLLILLLLWFAFEETRNLLSGRVMWVVLQTLSLDLHLSFRI